MVLIPIRLAIGAMMLASAAATWATGAGSADATRAQSPPGGTLQGRFEPGRLPRGSERRPEVSSPGAGPPRDRHEFRPGVVYLEQAPRGAFDEPAPARVVMDQRNERFVPHVLAVTVGTTVDFPNNDTTYHNVFSLSRAKRFDLGRYAVGKSKSVRMDRAGVVRVFCDIHSHMNAFVLVFAHRFFDVTDVNGRYRLPNVPPGTYAVVGWYEGEPRITRPVTVTVGSTVELDLLVP